LPLTRPRIRLESVSSSRLDQIDTSNLPFGSVFSDHMFVADYRDGHWGNPAIVPYAPLSMPPAMSALNYGHRI